MSRLDICFLSNLLVLFAQSISADYSRCYSVDDSSNTLICYSTNGTSNVRSWQAASDYCKANNSTLVAVGNVTVQNAIVQFRNVAGLGNSSTWIGVQASSSPLMPPNIRWIDGRPVTVTNSMIPDANVNVGGGRFFVSIQTVYHAQMWNLQHSYICQTTGNCSADDMFEGNLCYKKFEANVTWYEASNRCLGLMSGTLATFNASQPTDDSQLVTWLNGSTSGYWIGLTNTWWIDGKGNDVLYTNWQMNHPPTTFVPLPSTNCVLMANNANQNQWSDWDCTDNQPFICQILAAQQPTTTAAAAATTASGTSATAAAATTKTSSPPSLSTMQSGSSKLFVNLPVLPLVIFSTIRVVRFLLLSTSFSSSCSIC